MCRYACLYCMYILYKRTGPDTRHIHRTPKTNICPGVQNKIKLSKTARLRPKQPPGPRNSSNRTHTPRHKVMLSAYIIRPPCVWEDVSVSECVFTRAGASCLLCGSGVVRVRHPPNESILPYSGHALQKEPNEEGRGLRDAEKRYDDGRDSKGLFYRLSSYE